MRISLMHELPDELVKLIWNYVPEHLRALVDKSNYKTFHSHLYELIPERSRSALHRDLIRHDCSFVMTTILQEQFHTLSLYKRYNYQSMVHRSYLDFLHYLAQHSGASRCSLVIRDSMDLSAFGANRPKNNRTKGTRWTNLT